MTLVEWRVTVAEKQEYWYGSPLVTHDQNSGLVSVNIDWGLFDDFAAVGCVQSRQAVVRLRTTNAPYNDDSGLSLDGRVVSTDTGEASEWLYIGKFFISRRKKTGDITELTCYDPVLKTQGDFFENGADIGEWPQPMKTVAQQIAARIGCSLSVPSNLPDYPMEAPVGMTMRDVLTSMGAAWGGNWACRGVGAVMLIGGTWPPVLQLIPLGSNLGNYSAGKQAVTMATIGNTVSFTGIRLFWSDTDCFESGNCNDSPLECYCEWATQTMADNVWQAISGKSFQAFSATNAWLHPAIEPGDAITINGVTSQIITMQGSLSAGCALDIGFPGTEADEDLYPYEGPISRSMAKKVTLGKPYYGASISREQGLVVKRYLIASRDVTL